MTDTIVRDSLGLSDMEVEQEKNDVCIHTIFFVWGVLGVGRAVYTSCREEFCRDRRLYLRGRGEAKTALVLWVELSGTGGLKGPKGPK